MDDRTHLLRLPALRGSDPLGFLAAVGLVALAEQVPETIGPLRLGWEGSRTPVAVCESTASEVGELGERLRLVFESLDQEGRPIPGVPNDFPIKKTGTAGSDPMRMQRDDVNSLRHRALDEWLRGRPWLSRWVTAVQAPVARDDKGSSLTWFYPRTRQNTFRAMFEKAATNTAHVGGPADALAGWMRLKDFFGAGLDQRAVRGAAFSTDGDAHPNGAPSPTWMALMAFRMFPTSDDGTKHRTAGWLPLNLFDKDRHIRRSFLWPIWEDPLDAAALRALLACPPLNPPATDREGLQRALNGDALRGLAVNAVFGLSRAREGRNDGPLGAPALLWADG